MTTSASIVSAPSIDSEPVELTTTPWTLARAVHARRSEYVRPRRTKVKIGTWNVAACPGTDKDLARWFVDGEGLDLDMAGLNIERDPVVIPNTAPTGQDPGSAHLVGGSDIGLYVLGLQEVVDLNLTKEYMTRAVYTDNSATEKWQAALEAAMPKGYELVSVEQSFGLLLLVYASREIAPTIGNVSTKSVGTGMGGWFANKGAVSTRIILGETTRMVFVNCHLASGATSANLDRRCADTRQILSRTHFDAVAQAGVEEDEEEDIGEEDFAFWFGDLNFRLDGLPGDDIRRILTLHARGEYDLSGKTSTAPEGEGVIVMRNSDSDDDATTAPSHSRQPSYESETTLPDPDEFPEDPSQDPASLQATIDSLLPHDQLRKVMRDRKAFHDGWREGPITFLPSYKYDVGTVGLFDSSEKKRAPSWCDRILFRTRKDKQDYDSRAKEEEEAKKKDAEMRSRGIEEDEDVLFTYDPDTDGDEQPTGPPDLEYDEYDETEDVTAEEVVTKEGFEDRIKLEIYTSHQRITSSDHKPLSSIFSLEYDAIVPELKSKVYAEVARELDRVENEGRPAITVIAEGGRGYDESAVDLGEIGYLERRMWSLTVANTGSVPATFAFVEKPVPDGEAGESPVLHGGWLSTSFSLADPHEEGTETEDVGKRVTLEPGETIFAHVTARVESISLAQALNERSASLEDVLILRVEEGRDHFIPVKATWLASSFGRSMEELLRVPDEGMRKFASQPYTQGTITADDGPPLYSAPQELFKITSAMEDLAERCIADEAMLGDQSVPKAVGWPFEPESWTGSPSVLQDLSATLAAALDSGEPLLPSLPLETPSPLKLEALSFTLLIFIRSLKDGVIPEHVWLKLSSSMPTIAPAPNTRIQILDALSAEQAHNIAFVIITTAISRIAAELTPAIASTTPIQRRLSFRRGKPNNSDEDAAKRRRAKERRFAEVLAPEIFRTGDVAWDKAMKEKARLVFEMCIRPEEG